MFDINQKVFDGEYDQIQVEEFIEGLDEAFGESPEGLAFDRQYPDTSYLNVFLSYFFNYCGDQVMKMTADDVEELLFDIFPRKVSTPPDSAPEIIAEIRAFFSFLNRAYCHPNAPSILATLTVQAEQRLTEKLGDPASFGMAKSFFALGMKSGYDMTTEEGMQAFTAAMNDGLVGQSASLPLGLGGFGEGDDEFDEPGGAPLDPVKARMVQEKRRKARKAQRQARRKNRRK
jgi:hypothetical protein